MFNFFDPFEELHRRMHEFREAFEPFVKGMRLARTNVVERDKDIVVEFELPGVNKEDIQLAVSENEVEVKVAQKAEREIAEKKKGFYHYEAKARSFYRRIALPAPIIPEKTTSEYKNGVLRVVLPKAKPAVEKKKVIKIK